LLFSGERQSGEAIPVRVGADRRAKDRPILIEGQSYHGYDSASLAVLTGSQHQAP
jgi:hypothetical protein